MINRVGKGPILYSCNHAVKFHINEQYREGRHYVWCSEFFDSRADARLWNQTPKSSNPAQIFEEMEAALYPFDNHDDKIQRQRSGLSEQAASWMADGSISEEEQREIDVLLLKSDWDLWRPLLYVIPRTPSIEDRLEAVPPDERANTGMEFRIPDLRNGEFDVIFFNRRR